MYTLMQMEEQQRGSEKKNFVPTRHDDDSDEVVYDADVDGTLTPDFTK